MTLRLSKKRSARRMHTSLAVIVVVVLVGIGIAVGTSVASIWGGDRPTPSDVVNEPVQAGPTLTIATGPTPGGDPWTLLAYESNEGLCLELQGVTKANLGGASCTFDVPAGHSVSLNSEVFGEPAVTFVYGPVADAVTTIALERKDGKTLTLPTIPSPAGLTFEGRFYGVVLPGKIDVDSITGKSVSGATVEKRTE